MAQLNNNGHSTNINLLASSTSPTIMFGTESTPSPPVPMNYTSNGGRITTPEHIKSKKLPTYNPKQLKPIQQPRPRRTVPIFFPLGYELTEIRSSRRSVISPPSTATTVSTISFDYNPAQKQSSSKRKQTYHIPKRYDKPLPQFRTRKKTFDDGHDNNNDNDDDDDDKEDEKMQEQNQQNITNNVGMRRKIRRNSTPHINTPTNESSPKQFKQATFTMYKAHLQTSENVHHFEHFPFDSNNVNVNGSITPIDDDDIGIQSSQMQTSLNGHNRTQSKPSKPTPILTKISPSHSTMPPLIATQLQSELSENTQSPVTTKKKKHQFRVRRNSDTIVQAIDTPTQSMTASVKDSSFMHKIEYEPELNTINDSSISSQEQEQKSESLSDEDLNSKKMSIKKAWLDINVQKRFAENLKMIRAMLGFEENTDWDFDNDSVKVYHAQCAKIAYHKLVPQLKDVIYPTMLSSLALPQISQKQSYSISVKYNISKMIKKCKDSQDYSIDFEFWEATTTSEAINKILFCIKLRDEHKEYYEELDKLDIHCFVLKVCGREDYLKNCLHSGYVCIMSLSFIRNQIRQNQSLHGNAAFALIYNAKLAHYDIGATPYAPSIYKKESFVSLPYELNGYNCIGNTLKKTINDGKKIKDSLKRLHTDINDEIKFVQKKVPSIAKQSGAMLGVAIGNATNTPSYSNSLSMEINKVDIKWNEIDADAVRLSEFEHPIEFRINSLKNMTICPRIQREENDFHIFILRIELMFGADVFDECSFDVLIPKNKVSDKIHMPAEYTTFSTKDSEFFYSSLPREAIWCFTLYGIKKNASAEQEIRKKERQRMKQKQKSKPKILRFDDNANNASLKRPTLRNDISAQTKSDMIDDENINDFYKQQTQQNAIYSSEPLAFCRLPMVSEFHILRKGNYDLCLWKVPIFEAKKGGPKVDPYSTGLIKKFGSLRDCHLKTNNKINCVVLSIDFLLNDYKFDVVAPIVNMRRRGFIRERIKSKTQFSEQSTKRSNIINSIIQRDGIFPMDERDKLLVYSNKEKLMNSSNNIPTFLRSVKWLDVESRMLAYDYLERWTEPTNPEDMIELLRYEFADNRIRLYAINCLNKLDDYMLKNGCLLQLVQALKYELHHESFLSRFLIIRALNNPHQIGHYLYYHIKSEYDNNANLEWHERFGLLLEEYLRYLPYYQSFPKINLTQTLFEENELIRELKYISSTLQNGKKKFKKKQLQNLLHSELVRVNAQIFKKKNKKKTITLPLDPSYKIGALQVSKCKFMSSAKMPLWLVFDNGDKGQTFDNGQIETMFKYGDDLRQDILTLQLVSIMDSFWLKNNIDLNIKTYQVINVGANVGFIELVLNSKTTNDIGSLSRSSHLKYITKNKLNLPKQRVSQNYSRSVAGYSVATWTLGIGDRHPDNIMIHADGTLFHIDFGHFLGNFKEKDIGFTKWKRERTPFVFTKCMKYCIEHAYGASDRKSKNKASSDLKQRNYEQFVRWLFAAYLEIRIRYKFFLNLLLLMVPSQMPELITESDVSFFREILRFDLIDNQQVALHVEETLKQCLSDKNKTLDDMFHKIKHLK